VRTNSVVATHLSGPGDEAEAYWVKPEVGSLTAQRASAVGYR
jgi:hypothetical protein